MPTNTDYQYEFNGFKFGHGTPYMVTQVEGLFSLPDVVVAESKREGSDGDYFSGNESLSGRTMTFDLAVMADKPVTTDDLYEKFALATNGIRAQAPLYIKRPGRPERVVMCRVRRRAFLSDYDFAMGLAKGAIQFKANDPRLYDVNRNTVTGFRSVSSGSGRSYVRTYPRSYGETTSGSAGISAIVNNGTYETPARFRIFGPVLNPVIECVNLNKTLSFRGSVEEGDFLEVNLDNRTVMLNGTANRRYMLASPQWFMLQPGLNSVRFSGTVVSGSASLETSWQSAWI